MIALLCNISRKLGIFAKEHKGLVDLLFFKKQTKKTIVLNGLQRYTSFAEFSNLLVTHITSG